MTTEQMALAALNKLAKWRAVFAGWQLGTRPTTDPECQAVRDHREATLLLRAEVSALTAALITNGTLDQGTFHEALLREATQLDTDLEHRFPGITTNELGVRFDSAAAETMKGWKP